MSFHCYLAKKINLINTQNCSNTATSAATHINSLTWSQHPDHDGYIVAGVNDGSLEILRMNDKPSASNPLECGLLTPSDPLPYKYKNMAHAEQHRGGDSKLLEIVKTEWNDTKFKLTTADNKGLVIVWRVEEKITNKNQTKQEIKQKSNKQVSNQIQETNSIEFIEDMINKSKTPNTSIKSLNWSLDGERIALVYSNSFVMVGHVNGSREMTMDADGTQKYCKICWAGDLPSTSEIVGSSEVLLLGTEHGEIHAHSSKTGKFLQRVKILCLPLLHSDKSLTAMCSKHTGVSISINLAIVYKSGQFQLMTSYKDSEPLSFNSKCVTSDAKFSPNGEIFCIAGLVEDRSKIELFSVGNGGQHLKTLWSNKPLANVGVQISFDKYSQRLAIASDSTIYFANIRPDYKWGVVKNTLIYTYETQYSNESFICFWNLSNNETCIKNVRQILALSTDEENLTCVTAPTKDDKSMAVLCNSIGVVIANKKLEFKADKIAIGQNVVILADSKNCCFWFQDSISERKEIKVQISEGIEITSVCANKNLAVLAHPGILQIYHFPEGSKSDSLRLNDVSTRAVKMRFNSSTSLLGVVDENACFSLFDVKRLEKLSTISVKLVSTWDFKFSLDNPTTLAIMDKSHLHVFHNVDSDQCSNEEPQLSCNHIVNLEDMALKTVCLDRLVLKNPKEESPNGPSIISSVEMESLRKLRKLIKEDSVQAACDYATKLKLSSQESNTSFSSNSETSQKSKTHKIWKLLAEEALKVGDLKSAERSFVNCSDLYGIRFIKRMQMESSEILRQAHISSYLGDYKQASKQFADCDRMDLTAKMNFNLGIMSSQQVQIFASYLSDAQQAQAFIRMAEKFHIEGNFREMLVCLKKVKRSVLSVGEDIEFVRLLIECHYQTTNYAGIFELAKSLPDQHELLQETAELLASIGRIEDAANCLIKHDKIEDAINLAVNNHAWSYIMEMKLTPQKRQFLQDKLSIAAAKLIEKGEIMSAGRLYQESGLYKQGALLFFNYADQLAREQSMESLNRVTVSPLVLKMLYVLAGILTEKYHETNKKNSETSKLKNSNKLRASMALDGMLREEEDAGRDSLRLLEQGWRPAEAYHYFILLHRQLDDNQIILAQHTAQHLVEYEDLLGRERVWCLLALVALHSRQMALCSRAFLKLSSIAPEKYSDIEYSLFSHYKAVDVRPGENLLSHQLTPINENPSGEHNNHNSNNNNSAQPAIQQQNKVSKYPRCIVSGRPLTACQFWMCSCCRHCAFEEEIQMRKSCPLCSAIVE